MKLKRALPHVLFLLAAAGLWELLARVRVVDPFFTGSPSGIARACLALLADPAFRGAALKSLLNLSAGYLLALAAGAAGGLPAGYFPRAYGALRLYVQAAYSVPRVAFIPLLILWLGIGAPAKIAIIFAMTFFTVFIAAMEGARAVDRDLVDVCRVCGAGRLRTLLVLVLPSSAGPLLAGARLALGRAVAGMLLSETFGSPEGLGYLLFHYGALYEVNRMLAVLFFVTAFSFGLYLAAELLEKKLVKWRP